MNTLVLNLLFNTLMRGSSVVNSVGLLKKLASLLITFLEDLVERTENKFDDYLIPVLEVLRLTMSVGNPRYLSGGLKDAFNTIMAVNEKLDGDSYVKRLADKLLDYVEDYVEGTKSRIDDALVLPICKMVRSAFDIPEFEEEVAETEPEEESVKEKTVGDVVGGVANDIFDALTD